MLSDDVSYYNAIRALRVANETNLEQYSFEQKLTVEHIDFIRRQGRPLEGRVLGNSLSTGKLRELASSENQDIAIVASEILKIAIENTIPLLDDEYTLITSTGIRCLTPTMEGVAWYEKTRRASSRWRLVVCESESIAKWGILAPPNDIRKKQILLEWMKTRPDIVRQAEESIKTESMS